MVDLLTNVDLDLAQQVAQGIGVADPAPERRRRRGATKRLEAGWDQFGVTSRRTPGTVSRAGGRALRGLSMANTIKDTVKGRKVAILAANGVDADQLTAMQGGA